MTELLDPAQVVQVRLDDCGNPAYLRSAAGWQKVGRVLNRWRIDCEWWRRPVCRDYWRLLLDDELAVECYQDRLCDKWYLERVYD
jgi:hypothetical protein